MHDRTPCAHGSDKKSSEFVGRGFPYQAIRSSKGAIDKVGEVCGVVHRGEQTGTDVKLPHAFPVQTFLFCFKNQFILQFCTSALRAFLHTPGPRKAIQPSVHSQTESKSWFLNNFHRTVFLHQSNLSNAKYMHSHRDSKSGHVTCVWRTPFHLTFFVVVAKNSDTWAEEAKPCVPGFLVQKLDKVLAEVPRAASEKMSLQSMAWQSPMRLLLWSQNPPESKEGPLWQQWQDGAGDKSTHCSLIDRISRPRSADDTTMLKNLCFWYQI